MISESLFCEFPVPRLSLQLEIIASEMRLECQLKASFEMQGMTQTSLDVINSQVRDQNKM